MNEKKALGDKGELLARQFLEAQGLEILATNWRHRRGEADIVARNDTELIIIEVKTRRDDHFGSPEAGIGNKKQDLLAACAWAYATEHELNLSYRFDVISILLPMGQAPVIHHFRNAFFPVDEDFSENF